MSHRILTSHHVNDANNALVIEAIDRPNPGGACHAYMIGGFNSGSNKSDTFDIPMVGLYVLFQDGPIPEVGVNGVTHESLLAILEDRLQGFQSGPYACSENAEALYHIQTAQECLHDRTKQRLSRGVEGTHNV